MNMNTNTDEYVLHVNVLTTHGKSLLAHSSHVAEDEIFDFFLFFDVLQGDNTMNNR